ncbi:hypothetical protein CWI37_0022p0050 [Hamiltosporidium tvaerminnensis]|uniref:Uncharacterized protein n=1 Tax=Hamiltosporidium tvaerminnensis TaxID=1176355 RepID=A0A4Q9LCP9_9MICR|nr:hypothetical protein CWI37_0022p0050 [Hamiltosporidium tvaerminnensis]
MSIMFHRILSSTKVNFFIINEENSIPCLIDSDLNLEMIFLENKSVVFIGKEDKITLYKNNILRYESSLFQPKYYNPNILILNYENNMLLNSKLIRKLFDSKNTSVRIFLKNVSYSSVLLFLKLIDNLDNIVGQINIKDFLDILMIITVLDIEKSKRRDCFFQALLRNVMFEMQNPNLTFNFEEYFETCAYNITKSIFIDLWISFINFVLFNDKTAQRFIVLAENTDLVFKNVELFSNTYISTGKDSNDKIYIRLDHISLEKMFKIVPIRYQINTLIFLFKITNLDILYFVLNTDEASEKAALLFSDITFHTEKLYIGSLNYVDKLFFTKKVDVFSKKCKVLKIFKSESSYNAAQLKKLLGLCKNMTKITLKMDSLDFKRLKILVRFLIKNPNITCKVFCQIYELLHTNVRFLQTIPRNFKIYAGKFQIEKSDAELPIECLPFMHYYCSFYNHDVDTIFPRKFINLECWNFKVFELDFGYNTSPFEIDDSIFSSLRCMHTIKYIYFKYIAINDKLLLYILESKIITSVSVSKFSCSYNLNFLRKCETKNQKLKYFSLKNSLSYVDSDLCSYMKRLGSVASLKFRDIDMFRCYTFNLKKLYEYISAKLKTETKKICLKCIEIQTASNDDHSVDYLNILSEVYEFSKLWKIIYNVGMIREIEYHIFNEMKALKYLSIYSRHKWGFINFKKLFNVEMFKTTIFLTIQTDIIKKEDIEVFKKFKNLGILALVCQNIDYETVNSIKRNDFKTTKLIIRKPDRPNRSNEINNYLDSEFNTDFP